MPPWTNYRSKYALDPEDLPIPHGPKCDSCGGANISGSPVVTALSAKNPLEECRSTTELMMALCTRPIPRLEELMAPRTVARSLAEALRRALSTEPSAPGIWRRKEGGFVVRVRGKV